MANRLLLGIHFIFHQHTPEQAAVCLAFHQQTTDELGGDQLGAAGEKGLGGGLEGWEGVVAMGVAIGDRIKFNS